MFFLKTRKDVIDWSLIGTFLCTKTEHVPDPPPQNKAVTVTKMDAWTERQKSK